MATTSLIVGLGNPGPEYADTRHNAGFLLLEKLSQRWNVRWRDEKRFQSRLAMVNQAGDRILLCQPQTYMNASGEAIGALCHFYKVPTDRVLVAVDDADLALGTIRLRPGGRSGGHHGLDSIQSHLGGSQFARLRIGIAPGRRADSTRQITGFVLGRFARDEQDLLGRVLNRAADQAVSWLNDGVAKAMNDFNGAIDAPQNESE